MWTSNTMSFFDSLLVFAIGFSIVFICLISLAIFIIIASRIIEAIEGKLHKEEKKVDTLQSTAPKPAINKENEDKNNEVLAIIIGAISEEMREPIENFRIVDIKEI